MIGSTTLRRLPRVRSLLFMALSAIAGISGITHAARAQAVDFGDVAVGSFKDSSTTLTNIYPVAVQVTSLTMRHTRGDFTVISGGAPFTVPPGGSRTIGIRFTPSQAGLCTDSLIVAGTFTGSPINVPLIGTGLAVPVELSGFTAHCSADEVVLTWRTESETGNAGFSVMRTLYRAGAIIEDARVMAFVPGRGTTTLPGVYQHGDPLVGMYGADAAVYRLRQIDVDGGGSWSPAVHVELRDVDRGRTPTLRVFPNPGVGPVTITGVVPDAAPFHVRVIDMLGRCCHELLLAPAHDGAFTARFEDALFPASGLYVIECRGGSWATSATVLHTIHRN